MRGVAGCGLLLAAMACQAQIVTVDTGRLQGEPLAQTIRYLGIPYAAPPVGALRWRAPQDAPSWPGVYQATAARPACAQNGNYYASNDAATFDQPYGSEDCLYLNVWAPARAAGNRPVLLFIHGGSGIAGSGTYPAYDGARLAADTGAVVITTNYRLGFFGAIQLPALRSGNAAEDSGSFFLLDLIKSLDWIHKNIGAFGGDPGNVTLVGHSAGAVSVFALLRSPLAQGKFHKAVSLSGLPFSASIGKAQQRSDDFLQRLMLADGTISRAADFEQRRAALGDAGIREYLRGKRTPEIIAASKGEYGVPYVADGVVLPAAPEPDELVSEIRSRVPVMLGSVHNEASMLLLQRFTHADTKGIWGVVSADRPGGSRAGLFGYFSYLGFKSVGWFLNRSVTSQLQDLSDRLAAQAPSVYRYEFDWNQAAQPWREIFGAYHGLDVPFLFGNFMLDTPNFGRFAWTAENAAGREQLHRRMVAALRGFMETGDPNMHAEPGNPTWLRWDQRRYIQHWDSVASDTQTPTKSDR